MYNNFSSSSNYVGSIDFSNGTSLLNPIFIFDRAEWKSGKDITLEVLEQIRKRKEINSFKSIKDFMSHLND